MLGQFKVSLSDARFLIYCFSDEQFSIILIFFRKCHVLFQILMFLFLKNNSGSLFSYGLQMAREHS